MADSDYDFKDDMDAFGEPDTRDPDLMADPEADPKEPIDKAADADPEDGDYDFPEDPDGNIEESKEEPKEEEKGKEEEEFVARTDDFSPEIVERALKVGLDSDKLNALGDDALRILERLEGASKEDSAKDKTSQDDSDFEFEPLELKINEDQFDPELVSQFKAMNSHFEGLFRQQQERYKGVIDSLQSDLRAIQQEKFVQDFDQQVSKMGEDWEKVLGKGSTLELDEKSAAYRNRKAIAEEMTNIASGLRVRGRAVPPDGELFQRALRSVLGDRYEANIRESLAKQSKQRKASTFTPRAAGTTKQPQAEGKNRAIANLTAKFRAAGISD